VKFSVFDANANLPSGILSGNVNQYGDFDQCLDTVPVDQDFKSQYCLAHIQPRVSSEFKHLNYLRTLSLSYEAYKSEFADVS
jgi:Nose resistant-to-fluoxetine protein, N-terminal domain